MSSEYRPYLPLGWALALVLTGCRGQEPVQAIEAAGLSDAGAARSITSFEECPVTQPPDPPFTPPSPWPSVPPGESEFWFGTPGLWTALPNTGSWRQLAIGEKFWWWSQHYSPSDVANDSTPELVVAATQLGGAAASLHASEATNGFHSSFYQAMLIGVRLPAPGCWEFAASYMGNDLSFVLWVPAE